MTSNIVFHSGQREVMRISAHGITVAPGVTVDEAAKAVIAALDDHIKSLLENERKRRIEAAYLYTNVQSGDVVASTDPDWAEDEPELWHKVSLHKRD